MKKIWIFAVLISIFALAGCDDDDVAAYFTRVYNERCPESKTVKFQDLGANSLCRGVPIVFELLNVDQQLDLDVQNRLLKIFLERGVNFDVQDPATGRTPLMLAFWGNKSNWIGFFLAGSKNPNLVDKAGNTYLHYLADITTWGDQSRWISPRADLEIKNAQGLTPLQLAYSKKNYEIAWTLIKNGANAEFLSRDPEMIDPSFLYMWQAAENLPFLDSIAPILDRKFTGTTYSTRYRRQEGLKTELKDYNFASLAAEMCSPELSRFLLERGVLKQDTIACKGWDENGAVTVFRRLRAGDCESDCYGGPEKYAQRGFKNELGQNVATIFLANTPSTKYNGAFQVFWGGFDMFMELAKKYAWLDDKDIFGMTPVYYWLANAEQKSNGGFLGRHYQSSYLSTLLRNTASRAELNANGDSILSFAVMTGQKFLVEAVMDSDSKMRGLISTANAQGQTPLTLARAKGYQDIYAYLTQLR